LNASGFDVFEQALYFVASHSDGFYHGVRSNARLAKPKRLNPSADEHR
jgi:hypothetical protein